MTVELHSARCRHRGAGASKVQGHNVRENTLLSFQKAALNHSEFIEFDVRGCFWLVLCPGLCFAVPCLLVCLLPCTIPNLWS